MIGFKSGPTYASRPEVHDRCPAPFARALVSCRQLVEESKEPRERVRLFHPTASRATEPPMGLVDVASIADLYIHNVPSLGTAASTITFAVALPAPSYVVRYVLPSLPLSKTEIS